MKININKQFIFFIFISMKININKQFFFFIFIENEYDKNFSILHSNRPLPSLVNLLCIPNLDPERKTKFYYIM